MTQTEYYTESFAVCEMLTDWGEKSGMARRHLVPLTPPPVVPDVQIGFVTIKIQQDTFPTIILTSMNLGYKCVICTGCPKKKWD